ncbi:Ammonium Transporter Family protein [Trichomonas vaginalis G3]|uniref:Ammonium Transporter Family protein n=1 Tax=Trichomonas vaginalis (strain ATCC PRA-98 / G3) TaxID=412133 RepID=A2FF54_TRIV3|nr:ammonium transmembrane transporter protein [Trichomonas vaginalis G3]EAX96467.1 Ammonium Transporter Family protein [Trichomonas vaginalis G3]KAI5503330.1 ammonium transmembrane transporter protein [Trichomonas vaginalis G3]|eukprot:XP_001309397.1 Ammonium Transporter Family protein [Trichomonas vaginalis G3]
MFLFLLSLVSCNGPALDTRVVAAANFDTESIYPKVVDVWFMTILIAFLMMFIKKFEWGVMLATLLSSATVFIFYAFLKAVAVGHDGHREFTERIAAEAVLAAIAYAISIGVFVGTIKYWQYIMVGIVFSCGFYLVDWLIISEKVIKGCVDPGGAIAVHMFACYFGIGVALAVQEKRVVGVEYRFTTHSINWLWLAVTLLFVLWPSFTSIFWKGKEAWEDVITTYMAGLGSIISAYFAELACKKGGKIDPLIYAVALLGGCVGISTSLFIVGPWGGLLVGVISGIVSVCSFNYLHPVLQKKLGIGDVMGVHNLHGVCSWVATFVGLIGAYCKKFPGIWTLVGALISFSVSLIFGLIGGALCRLLKFGEIPNERFMLDRGDFIFPESEGSDNEEPKKREEQVNEL